MQLLKITSTPIEYEIKIEKASLQMPVDQPQRVTQTTPAQLSVDTTPTTHRIDSSEFRRNVNMRSNIDYASENARIARENADEVVNEYINMGKSLSQIQNGTKVSDYYRNKVLSEASNIPTIIEKHAGSPEISWSIGDAKTNFSKPSVKNEWQVSKNRMEYIPGRFHMDIIQMPKVSVEYVGDPVYVPPSSAPGYEAPVE